jgi:hypothetical protein
VVTLTECRESFQVGRASSHIEISETVQLYSMVRVFNTVLDNFIQYFCEFCLNGMKMAKLGRKILRHNTVYHYVISYITYVSRVRSFSNPLKQLTHRDYKHKNAAFCLLGFDRDDLPSPNLCLRTPLRMSYIRLADARLYVRHYVEVKYVSVSGKEELRRREKITPGFVFWHSTASILPSSFIR